MQQSGERGEDVFCIKLGSKERERAKSFWLLLKTHEFQHNLLELEELGAEEAVICNSVPDYGLSVQLQPEWDFKDCGKTSNWRMLSSY